MKASPEKLEPTVERELVIQAPRATVFRYFTDSARFARWWGAGSTIEGRAGGALRIVYPNGIVSVGEVLEIVPEERVVFSFGFESGTPFPPGSSRVTVTLADHAQGTLLRLVHALPREDLRDHLLQGWRYQLAVFANVAADEAHADVAGIADRWFAAWNEADPAARRRAFAACASADVAFADLHSCTRGLDDLAAHVTAGKVHMPGLVLERSGAARHCQGSALVDWTAKGKDGTAVGRGTNLFECTPDGRIARVIGFWAR